MDRRAFLIAAGGWLLGANKLPQLAAPVHQFYQPVNYLIMPSYFKPFSAASWLELADGAWQPMLFEADSDADHNAIASYEQSLQNQSLNYEQVARAPRQPGKWTVRLRDIDGLWYITTTDQRVLSSDEAELDADPHAAPLMSHDEAVRLTLFLLRRQVEPDVFTFYEPVQIERAIADCELDGRDLNPLGVDYLPTGYRCLQA